MKLQLIQKCLVLYNIAKHRLHVWVDLCNKGEMWRLFPFIYIQCEEHWAEGQHQHQHSTSSASQQTCQLHSLTPHNGTHQQGGDR